MSANNPNQHVPNQHVGENGTTLGTSTGTILAPAQRRGRRGVTLRSDREGGPSMQDMLDPASRSLADALKITYRLLVIAMVVMIAAYFLSGFKRVNESESGVRTVLGKIAASDIPPGFTPSFPEPIGELIRVKTGLEAIKVDKAFFFRLSEAEEKTLAAPGGLQSLANGGSNALDPDVEGALLTADGNLVHTQVKVTYRRTSPSKNVQNIADDDASGSIEREIVIAAVRRGMVMAAARTSIDEFIRNQAEENRADNDVRNVAQFAKDVSQQMLTALGSGIEIQELLLEHPTAPRPLMNSFNDVQTSQSKAAKDVSDAEAARKERLSITAGDAAPVILTQIDEYERQLSLGDQAKAAAVLAKIHALMLREPVEINGKTAVVNTFGKVSNMISEANRYRTEVVGKAQASAGLFEAKRAAFASNPEVMIASEWTNAMQAFLTRDSVQVLLVPPGAERVTVQLNRDPSIKREQEQAQLQKEAMKADVQRDLERRRQNAEKKFDSVGGE